MKKTIWLVAATTIAVTCSGPAAALPQCTMMFEPMMGDECIHNGRVCVVTRDASAQETVHLRCRVPRAARRKATRGKAKTTQRRKK